MSFAGTVFDMIQRIKFNEGQKKSNRIKRAKLKDAFLKHSSYSEINHSNKTFSKEEVELAKSKIRLKIIRERKIEIIKTIAIISALILIPLILYREFSH